MDNTNSEIDNILDAINLSVVERQNKQKLKDEESIKRKQKFFEITEKIIQPKMTEITLRFLKKNHFVAPPQIDVEGYSPKISYKFKVTALSQIEFEIFFTLSSICDIETDSVFVDAIEISIMDSNSGKSQISLEKIEMNKFSNEIIEEEITKAIKAQIVKS